MSPAQYYILRLHKYAHMYHYMIEVVKGQIDNAYGTQESVCSQVLLQHIMLLIIVDNSTNQYYS